MFSRLRSLGRMLFKREEFERSMADEMEFHRQAYADDLIRGGVAPEDAHRRARIEFGSEAEAQEAGREARGVRWFDEVRQDLTYATRQLRRSPAFTAAAVLSLALGIGANTAIFGLVDAMLFRTIPVREPERLYFAAHGVGGDRTTASNYPLFERYRSSPAFASVTAFRTRTLSVAGESGLERVEGQLASGNYHSMLGVPFTLGRGFTNEPDRADGRPLTAVISDAYWARRFGRAPDVIGRTLSVGGRTATIIGVTAPTFSGLTPGVRADITLPLWMIDLGGDQAFFTDRDRWIALRIVLRLRDDWSEQQSQAAASDVFQRYWLEPESGHTKPRQGVLMPASHGADDLRERYGAPLFALLGMVGIVLLIACANVANLSFARTMTRAKEVAVRLSIGATRARIVRQMLTESALLALVGAALGLILAGVLTRFVSNQVASGERPIILDATVNANVLGFTVLVSALTVVLFGLAPALRSSRVDVTPALKDARGSGRRSRWIAGRALVAGQIGLATVIVSVAALFGRTIVNLRAVDGGFARENTVLFNIDADDPSLTPDSRRAFFAALTERLLGLPGVTAVAEAQRTPLDRSTQTRPLEVPGLAVSQSVSGVSANVVTPEFFPIFGIMVRRGRGLNADDRAGAEPVAVVDERLARDYFGSIDPIGRRIELGADREPFTIVGVVSSVRFDDLREDPPRMIYTAIPQAKLGSREVVGDVRRIAVIVRTSGSPEALAGIVRGEVASLSRNVVVSWVRTMEQQLDGALLIERLMARLSGGYGLLALLMSVIGLYGITSFAVARRTHEIGVRMALGASRGRVLGSVLRETLLTSVIGIAIGVAATLAVTRLIVKFLYGVEPRDPATLAIVVTFFAATALLAGMLPARRAASIDPVRALKHE